MTNTDITLDCTGTTATVTGDRMAVAHATFSRICREAGMGDLTAIAQIHIDLADDDFAALDALDDSLRARARAVSDFKGGERVWVLLTGEGAHGCDVWALGSIDA